MFTVAKSDCLYWVSPGVVFLAKLPPSFKHKIVYTYIQSTTMLFQSYLRGDVLIPASCIMYTATSLAWHSPWLAPLAQ